MDIEHSHSHQAPSRSRCWRDAALEGGWLADATYREHTFEKHLHDELVIAVTTHGSGEARTRTALDRSEPGTVWVFAPAEYHCGRVCADEGWSYRAAYLDAQALRALDRGCDTRDAALHLRPGLYRDAEAAALFVRAHHASQEGASLAHRQEAWTHALSLLLHRYAGLSAGRRELAADKKRLARARDYVSAHYRGDFSIDDLAQAVGLSRYHLMRAFRNEFGLPPHAFANQLRLIEAKRLLAEGQTPADVAVDVGFYDQSHFTRLFKRAYDVTPARFAALRPH